MSDTRRHKRKLERDLMKLNGVTRPKDMTAGEIVAWNRERRRAMDEALKQAENKKKSQED